MTKRVGIFTLIFLCILLVVGIIGILTAGELTGIAGPGSGADYMEVLPTQPHLPEGLKIPLELPHVVEKDIPRQGIFWQDKPNEMVIDELISEMTDEQLIGQVFLLGWSSELAQGVIVDWITQRNLGGVKIFGWNGNKIDRLASTISTLQTYAMDETLGIPLFTATDQEGGWVRHVKDTTSITPGNMSLGASGLPIDSYLSGYYIGLEMRAIGINMNFAPTVDVYVNPEAHVIGPRAFSSDPQVAASLGLAFFKGMDRTRVISTAKHFPGHGNARGDSHGEMPIILDDLQTLRERDLVPYRVLIDEGLPAILSGHLSFPEITGNLKPASLNPFFKHQILRDELHFEGLAITDDLFMEGAWVYGAENEWGIERIALEALRAGNDIIMLSKTPELVDGVWTVILEEFSADDQFRKQILNSVRRILRVKLEYLKGPDAVPLFPDPDKIYEQVPARESAQFFADQAGRGIHIVRPDYLPLPKTIQGEQILLVGQDPDFISIGKQYFPGADIFQFAYEPFYWPDESTIKKLQAEVVNYQRIIFNLANPNSLGVLKGLAQIPGIADHLTVLSILTPVYLSQTPWVRSAVAVYGWGKESFHAGFSFIQGKTSWNGSNPIPALLPEKIHQE